MSILAMISLLFLAISLLFFALSLRDHLKEQETDTITRRIRFRMALVFAVVGAGLYLLNTFFH